MFKLEGSQIAQLVEAIVMKRAAQVLCVLVALSAATHFAISYIGGRIGSFLAVPPFLPAEVVSDLVSFIVIVALFILLCRCLLKRTNRAAVFSMFLLSLLLASIPWMVVPARVFQVGFRHRVTSRLSAEELRQIAVVATAVMDQERTNILAYCVDTPREQWEKLEKPTQINRLRNRLPMTVLKTDNAVKLSWGGALVGHWGVIIDNGVRSGSAGSRGGDDIAIGIRTFIGPD